MKTFAIYYHSLNDTERAEFLTFSGAETEEDLNTDSPIALVDFEMDFEMEALGVGGLRDVI